MVENIEVFCAYIELEAFLTLKRPTLRQGLERQPDANVSPVSLLPATQHATSLAVDGGAVVREFNADLRSLRNFSSTE